MQNAQHLDDIGIRNFKGLADVEIDRSGAFNLLLGANDVGKTSVLEALFLITGCTNLNLPVSIHNQRNYVVQSFDDLSHFFHRLDIESPIELTARSIAAEERRKLLISAPYVRVKPTATRQQIGAARDASDMRSGSSVSPAPRVLRYKTELESKGVRRPFSGDLKVRSPAEIETPQPSEDASEMIIPARIIMPGLGYDVSSIAELIVNKKDSELLQLLRAINPDIQRIAVNANMAYLDVGLAKMVPLNMFGGGMVRAADILSHCILGNTKILLIDEIENGFHHTALRPLLEALLTLSVHRGVQIFATSHSIEILRHLQQILHEEKYANLRPSTVCYSLVKDRHARVQSYRYEYSQFDHCITHDIEIR